ncbi:MAG: hypothetical protein HPY76_01590 [Anaerolineae bacterium]|nr:hypothetical protein [Anaerolineae bacterium]
MNAYLKRWEKVLKVALIVLLLIIAVIFSLNFEIGDFKTFLLNNEKYGLLIALTAYILLGVTFIPAEPVTFLVLTWKGPLIAIILATMGNTLAGVIEFFIGGNIGDIADFQKKKEKLPFKLGRLPIDSPLFLLLARMLPGFGPKFVSIAGGAFGVPITTFLWTMVVSNLMGAGFIVLFAAGVFAIIK